MSDSVELDFKKSFSFLEQFNLKFSVSDMKATSNKFRLVLVSDCNDDFKDCIDGNGVLNSSNTVLYTIPCSLKWNLLDENTVEVSLRNTVSVSIGTDIKDLRAVFLTNTSNYVMLYSIFNHSIQITNKMVFEKDTLFFSIGEGRGA